MEETNTDRDIDRVTADVEGAIQESANLMITDVFRKNNLDPNRVLLHYEKVKSDSVPRFCVPVGATGTPYFLSKMTTEMVVPVTGNCGRRVLLHRVVGDLPRHSFARVRDMSKRCRAEKRYLKKGLKYTFVCSFYLKNMDTKVYVLYRNK